jgi:hypothetical protein
MPPDYFHWTDDQGDLDHGLDGIPQNVLDYAELSEVYSALPYNKKHPIETEYVFIKLVEPISDSFPKKDAYVTNEQLTDIYTFTYHVNELTARKLETMPLVHSTRHEVLPTGLISEFLTEKGDFNFESEDHVSREKARDFVDEKYGNNIRKELRGAGKRTKKRRTNKRRTNKRRTNKKRKQKKQN